MNLKAFARNTIRALKGQTRQVVILLLLLIGFTFSSYAQTNPPAPARMSAEGDGPPCDPGDDGNGGGPSPPPGLCLPIDDYVYILMAVGVMYGCYKLRNFEPA